MQSKYEIIFLDEMLRPRGLFIQTKKSGQRSPKPYQGPTRSRTNFS